MRIPAPLWTVFLLASACSPLIPVIDQVEPTQL
jgi:hypothetical protein